MQKQAPTLGRMLVMVGFALSCFGLLLFLWLAFGGADPAQAEGLPVRASRSPRARSSPSRPTCGSPASRSARSRPSSPNRETGRSIATHRARGALRAARQGHQGDPAPEDAARRDLRRADAGQPAARRDAPRGRRAAGRRRSRRPSSSTRSSARSTPRRAARSRPGCRSSRAPLDGRARDISDALGNLEPFAEDANESC